MIVFDLKCSRQHSFEGWFRSSEDFTAQQSGGLLDCPQCGCVSVVKAPMAPAVPAKSSRLPVSSLPDRTQSAPATIGSSEPFSQRMPPEIVAAFSKLAAIQKDVLAKSRWVGDNFADRSRAIHYGDVDDEQIHGRASAEEAASLLEEGITVVPLIIPVVPPEEAN